MIEGISGVSSLFCLSIPYTVLDDSGVWNDSFREYLIVLFVLERFVRLYFSGDSLGAFLTVSERCSCCSGVVFVCFLMVLGFCIYSILSLYSLENHSKRHVMDDASIAFS
jgi:hypothetical protein